MTVNVTLTNSPASQASWDVRPRDGLMLVTIYNYVRYIAQFSSRSEPFLLILLLAHLVNGKANFVGHRLKQCVKAACHVFAVSLRPSRALCYASLQFSLVRERRGLHGHSLGPWLGYVSLQLYCAWERWGHAGRRKSYSQTPPSGL